MSRRTWLLILVFFSVVGCAAWLVAGRPRRISLRPRGAAAGMRMGPAEALRRHPAGRAMGLDIDSGYDPDCPVRPRRPLGPDDDPEFLLELERRIRESGGDR